MNRERLLLCRPHGGLNDVLCQIESCCRYAERFDRTVFVDTNFSSAQSFKDDFSKYFVSLRNRLVLDTGEIRGRLDELDVYPGFIKGRVTRYSAGFDRDAGRVLEQETKNAVGFDFKKDFSEPLLVHQGTSFESGAISLAALTRMRLQESLVAMLRQRLDQIGQKYSALHIRNTDHQTDYERWIAQNGAAIRGPIFVATDNRDVVADCRSAFGAERVFSFAKLPSEAGQPLHRMTDVEDVYARNCDAILDLLMLALSENLYVFELKPNRLGAKYSGFSVLASNLKGSPPILEKLISAPS